MCRFMWQAKRARTDRTVETETEAEKERMESLMMTFRLRLPRKLWQIKLSSNR